MANASIIEIFSSIQGEGLYAGRLHVFVRFAGCDLNCAFCDTPEARDEAAGTPMSVKQLITAIEQEQDGLHHMVSLTGGEPLTHSSFLSDFLKTCRRDGRVNIPYLLETNGALPQELEKIIAYVDVISMDIKLPGVYGGPELWYEHAEFLKIAAIKEVCVKVPVDSGMPVGEFMQAVDLVSSLNANIPFFIQPIVAKDNTSPRLTGAELLEYARAAAQKLTRVSVMPQLNKILKLK
ncbi:MAG: 7-carboxy-7-deazaguanine synthase QueE [Actinomycetota bacterium]